jgi:hypothetical protein
MWMHTSPQWFPQTWEAWAAAITLIVVLWGLIIVPLGKLFHRAWVLAPVLSSADKSLVRIEGNVARIESKIADMAKELTCNGGATLKDEIIKIRTQSVDNGTELQAVKVLAQGAKESASRAEETASQALRLLGGNR